MPNPTHVYVTAAEGKLCPWPASEASSPAGQLRVEPGKVYRVPYTTFSRRRLNSGDVLLCTRDGKIVKPGDLTSAAAPNEEHQDETGAIALGEVTAQGSTAPMHTAGSFDMSDTPRRKG